MECNKPLLEGVLPEMFWERHLVNMNWTLRGFPGLQSTRKNSPQVLKACVQAMKAGTAEFVSLADEMRDGPPMNGID